MAKKKFTEEQKTIYDLGYLNGKEDTRTRMKRSIRGLVKENTQLRKTHNKLIKIIESIDDKQAVVKYKKQIAKLKRTIKNIVSVLKVLDEHGIK